MLVKFKPANGAVINIVMRDGRVLKNADVVEIQVTPLPGRGTTKRRVFDGEVISKVAGVCDTFLLYVPPHGRKLSRTFKSDATKYKYPFVARSKVADDGQRS